MEVPGKIGSPRANLPALFIRMHPFDVSPTDASGLAVRVRALLDTGASVSSVPMWLLYRMGASVDKGSRYEVFGASGGFYAYKAKIGVEIEHNEGWLDIGVISVIVPDTEWSRNPRFRLPFLLGRGAFSTSSTCASASPKRRCGSTESADGRRPARRHDDVACAGPRNPHMPDAECHGAPRLQPAQEAIPVPKRFNGQPGAAVQWQATPQRTAGSSSTR